MAGRGKGLLQALKEKQERERSLSPSSLAPRQPLPSPPAPLNVPAAAAAAAAVPAPVVVTGGLAAGTTPTIGLGRGVGRGQLAALLASRQPSSSSSSIPHTPSPTSTTAPTTSGGADQLVYYSAEKASQPVPRRLSPIEPLPVVVPPTLQKTSTLRDDSPLSQQQQQQPQTSAESVLSEAQRLASRGRGLVIGRGRLPGAVIPREESQAAQVSPPPPPAPVQPTPAPPQPTAAVSVAAVSQVQSQLTRMTLVEEIPDLSRQQQTTSSPTVVSKRSDGDGGQTVLTSTATGTGRGGGGGGGAGGTGSSGGVTRQSAGSASLQKAEDELRIVEQIKRKSPVQKMGVDGVPAQFVTNYIKLSCRNKGVYQYIVHFNPSIDSKYHRVKIIYFLSEIIGNVRLFDGVTLFLPILLKDKLTTTTVKRKINEIEQDVEVRIQLTKILPPEQLPEPVFNIIFKSIMKELHMTRIGQHYYSPAKQIDVSQRGLQIWPGYETAVHDYQNGLYLVMDVSHKILRSQTCWDVMNKLYTESNHDLNYFRQAVTKTIVGSIVLTKYNNKTYRVDDILWEQNPKGTFRYHDNQTISYVDYYKQHYDITINDLQQPLLFNRPKVKESKPGATQTAAAPTDVICLVPELCFMTGLSEEQRADFNVKKDLQVHTRLSPEDRYKQLKKLVENIQASPKAMQELQKWGLDLADDITRTPGRVVPSEKIFFKKREIEIDYKCDWTRAAGNEEVLSAVELRNWLIVYPGNKEPIVARFCELAIENAHKIGIRIAQPITVPLRDDRPDTYYNEIKKNLEDSIQMVVVVLPMLSDTRYQRIKRLCCIEFPVPSQIIVAKTINKPDQSLRSIAQKIILQMNVKLGGELWRMNIPIKRLMIVGIDVYHKVEKGFKSIAGFVSSMNTDQTRWYSRTCIQMVGQELADMLKVTFSAALKKYKEVNGFMPDKIVVFRDGVSDSQINIVAEHECEQLRSCFSADYNPKMCVIVVQKRISTRIFAISANNNNSFSNPKPGTVIDHTITGREFFDFFLVSQNVNQGTVTPTRYIVPYDDTGMAADHIQRLSYKMTHMYYNWSGTIRVPAPCQYAHKLAFLTGQYLQGEAHETLCNRLFYL